jgi:hypothetical protein
MNNTTIRETGSIEFSTTFLTFDRCDVSITALSRASWVLAYRVPALETSMDDFKIYAL